MLGFVQGTDGAAASKAALNRALELDGALPQAHLALANADTWRDWNWAAAEPEYRLAIEVLPNDADARVFYARYLALDMLERLFQVREGGLPEIGVAAIYRPLHDRPRFRALLAQMPSAGSSLGQMTIQPSPSG